ncbi:hypothetical protein VTL71DRAFT_15338 [Oculimacula yallundae]|uniref:MYND-type domain-containing protein n=1 Tax=Oculimacula yallundae TaxID=86028 RepID=A0ABR4CGB4_9HELO
MNLLPIYKQSILPLLPEKEILPVMSSFPMFGDAARFPAFTDCPVLDNPTAPDDAPYYLLGTIGENMTASAAPTFILKDRNNVSFALTLRIPADEIKESVLGGGLDVSGFKKGFTAVVEDARRSGVKEGKSGFVVAPSGSVKIIPASLQKLSELNNMHYENVSGESRSCQACSTRKPKDELLTCTGCRCVWYCNKECQTLGWKEKNHKKDCKIFKSCLEILL